MSRLCNHCECTTINGMRCHERGCQNQNERIQLVDDGTLDTVFRCGHCDEQMRFSFDPTNCGECSEDDDECDHYDDFVYECLRECQDDHECETEDWDNEDWISEDED